MVDFKYLVMDIGCIECGVSTLPVGLYRTLTEAQDAMEKRDLRYHSWRDGGQAEVVIFKVGEGDWDQMLETEVEIIDGEILEGTLEIEK